MAETERKQSNYRIESVEEQPVHKAVDRLEKDPLDDMPDVSAQTGGLPIVTFILICLAACCMILIGKVIVSGSILLSMACLLFVAILVFGIAALIRGMFTKLHNQKEPQYWYAISAAVMAVGVLAGMIIGILVSF
ncbi:MAG: hypothetical protein Q4C40_03120 [Eubacteriales bacterium]|nr:hypothetical protein [Eubacteriales bacterium]